MTGASHAVFYCTVCVYRCESGDMSGKHGQLSIAYAVPGRPSYTYVDPNLYLSGGFTSECTTY